MVLTDVSLWCPVMTLKIARSVGARYTVVGYPICSNVHLLIVREEKIQETRQNVNGKGIIELVRSLVLFGRAFSLMVSQNRPAGVSRDADIKRELQHSMAGVDGTTAVVVKQRIHVRDRTEP